MTSKSKGKRTSAIGRRYKRRRAAQRRYTRRGRASKGSRPKEKPNTNGKQNNQPQRTYTHNRNTSIHTGASIPTYYKYNQTSKGSIPKENTNTNGKQNNQPKAIEGLWRLGYLCRSSSVSRGGGSQNVVAKTTPLLW